MTTAINNKPLAPGAKALTALRALAVTPPESVDDALTIAERQAQLLRDMLPPGRADPIPTHLTDLIPTIRVVYVDDIPVQGITFWARGHWNIHVRASDAANVQTVAVLHGLKHIIDHPLRQQQPGVFTEAEWDALADYFARHVLERIPGPTTPVSTANRKEGLS